MRFTAIAPVLAVMCGVSTTAVLAETGRYFTCSIPNGFEAAKADLERTLFAATDRELSGADGGWYRGNVVTGSVGYAVSKPIVLPVADYPYFVGSLWGGPPYGGKLLSQMVCGFSLSSSGWMVTIEWEGHGFASFDIRDALASVPPPSKSDIGPVGEAPKALPPHEFRFTIDGQDFSYLLSGITIAMNRVFRPDLAQDDRYKATIDDDLFPALDSVSGILLAAASYGNRPEWTQAVTPAKLQSKSRHWFTDDPYTQPFDTTATPQLLGRVMAVSSGGTKEPGQPADLELQNNILTLTMPDGRTGQVDISTWASALLNSSAPGIPNPLIRFEIDGQSFGLAVSFASPVAGSSEMERLIGDLLAGDPPLVKDARKRETQPKRQ
jgi:hypothetical protein